MATLLIPKARPPRQFTRSNRQMNCLHDEALWKQYRFGSEKFKQTRETYWGPTSTRKKQNFALLPQQQILIALRFYASVCFLRLIGDTFCNDIATVSWTITRVTDILINLKDEYIKFPTTMYYKQLVQQGVYQ
jgi:hypothetical protein